MSLDDFLNDVHQQEEEMGKRSAEGQLEAARMENERKIYLDSFAKDYEERVVPLIDEFKAKLASKFELEYTPEISSQLYERTLFAEVKITPKFKNRILRVVINIAAESERKLISVSDRVITETIPGKEDDRQGNLTFQENMDIYLNTDLESLFEKSLRRNFTPGKQQPIKKYYVAPAHQSGKWAVFTPEGAQLQGTAKNTEEEAQGIADSFNKTQ